MELNALIAECTAYDFKVMLEEKKPIGNCPFTLSKLLANSSLKFEIKAKQFYAASQRVL